MGCRIRSPCAACKTLRKKCGEKCPLAPYFPPENPERFLAIRRVFGTKSILKILRDVPAERREDAVMSMVYEATARLNDPAYGLTGVVSQLEKQVIQLESQLATAQAQLLQRQTNLERLITGKGETENVSHEIDGDPVYLCDPLWIWD